MKAVIQEVKFHKETKGKYGPLFIFHVKYDDVVAVYRSKSKDQKNFVPGQEAEFTEEEQTYSDQGGNIIPYKVVKPIFSGAKNSTFGRALKKEQSRYSGFAMSYAKDLVVAGIIKYEDMLDNAELMFNVMVAMDKKLES